MSLLIFSVCVLSVLVLGLIVMVFALARQIGILFERISPVGAMINDSGPKLGEVSPAFNLPSLTGGLVQIGAASSRYTLIFFLSPTCPVCKKLLPILKSVATSEKSWLDVALASDGEEAAHRAFVRDRKLEQFPYLLSRDLGVAYRVSRLPYGVLIDNEGVVRAKGLVNNREQLESLFNARELGHDSVQAYIDAVSQAR